MSDSFEFTDIYNFKFKKSKFLFPLGYLRDILNGIQKLFLKRNILIGIKSAPISLYNRLFGFESRRHIINVLVLIADLESNVGAACIELLNNESPEILKNYNFRQNFSYGENNSCMDDYSFENRLNDSMYDYPAIDSISYNNKEESKVLDANLYSEDSMDDHINPDYFTEANLSIEYLLPTFNEIDGRDIYSTEIKTEGHELNSNNALELKPSDWNSFDTWSFTEPSTSAYSCEEFGNKENDLSDCETDYSSDNDYQNFKILPKPIKREIHQLKMLSVPYDYYDITLSSHEVFKSMKCNPALTKSQITAMANARRRYINRQAATRCRTQKLQQRDQLKLELKKLQNQLIQTNITLTKAYQQRNEMRDQYRIIQKNLIFRLNVPGDKVLNSKRWSMELKENKSLILIENVSSS